MESRLLQDDGNRLEVALPPTSDLRSAEPLHAALVAALAGRREVRIDAADVDRLSSVVAQLLVAARRSFAAGGVTLRITNPSSAVRGAFEDLGLSGELEIHGA